ncbi:MAG: endolytic transglycosylase MltG, partial [Nitrospiria bacterium]
MMTRRRITRYLLFPIVAVGIIQWGLSLNEAPTSVERQKTIEIPEGASFHKVTHLLSREGLIAKPVYFRILGKLTRSEKRIKPGEYLLHTAMRPTELLEVLVGGRIVLHRAVIPEGSSSRQIATILEEADLVSADAFLQAVHDP